MKVKNLTPDVDISAIEITQSDVNRPALQLAGFFDYFDHHRIQIIGQVEHTYMEKQGIEESLKQMKRILSYKVPGIVFCRDLPVPEEFLELANEYQIPILQSHADTSAFSAEVTRWLKVELAPRISIHGVLVDIYGEGVLITGESGTGKELIAEAIHANSPRSKEAFVKVNLGGLSQSLFESEMFGHKKGAFTDLYMDRVGRFEMANKGTIFLDEIGDLELSCQVKLLRVLQDQTFEVLGDSRPRKVDIRVVSATNRDLRSMVADRTFREDLFYRINLITVHLPALRERREDIPLLARYFADKQSEINGLPRVEFSSDAQTYLSRLPFPGNIRELKNLVERTILVSGKTLLDTADFEVHCMNTSGAKSTIPPSLEGLTLDELEKQTILRSLEAHGGNLSHVATALGISRAALYRRLEKYGIPIDK